VYNGEGQDYTPNGDTGSFSSHGDLGFTNDSPFKSIQSPEFGYDPLARDIANEFNLLRQDPEEYADSVDYNHNAYSEAKSFERTDNEMRWNDALVNGS